MAGAGRIREPHNPFFIFCLSFLRGCAGWGNPSSINVSLESKTRVNPFFISHMEAAQQEKQGKRSSCFELSLFASELLLGSEVQGGGKGDARQLGNVMPSTSFL